MTETPSDPGLSPAQRRIAILSRRVAAVLGVAVFLAPVVLAVYVFAFPEQLATHPGVAILRLTPRPLDLPHLLGACGALFLEAAPALWGLWHLRRLFQGYAAGAVFTTVAAKHFRCFAWAVLLSAVSRPLGWMILSMVVAAGSEAGPHGVISLSSDDLVLVLVGSALLVIGRVMSEAARIAEDNAGFV